MGFRCFRLIRSQEVVKSVGQMVWELENSWIKPDKWASEWSKPRMIVHPVISLRARGKWVGNPPGL